MPISHTDCTPYLSATLFRTGAQDRGFSERVCKAVIDALRPSSGLDNRPALITRRFRKTAPPDRPPEGLDIAWLHYEEKRTPSWYVADDLKDTHNHLVIVCRKNTIVALCFSDPAARRILMRTIAKATTKPLDRLSRLRPEEVETAFVEGHVRTLWLNGAHRRTVIKPDGKVLSGLELESALDPLDDQTYYFSSVRSTSTNQQLSMDGRSAVVGASPQHARIWIGPTRSWDEFVSRIGHVLDQAAVRTAGDLPTTPSVPILAQATRGLDGVEKPYDMALIVPELALTGIDDIEGDERWLQQFSDAARFDIASTDQSPDFETDVFWGDELLGRLACFFETRDTGNVKLKVEKICWNEDDERNTHLLKICQNPDFLTVYFDTGHTYARGGFYRTQFRDARFTNWRWVNMARGNINFRQEKPVDGRRFAVENIGNEDDLSLFGLVARNWPDLENRGAATGWLVCDDGSMESADFIHFDDTTDPPKLTLIHVKGSHSDSEERGISVSDYEVVVGQAVKNLRHIDRDLLVTKLRGNSGGNLRDAVWHNGERQGGRDGILEVLEHVGSNMDKHVVILQPRVRRRVYDRIRDEMRNGRQSAEIRRMQQLDTLLLGARADCYSLGASFIVIADDDV